ncbi:hypothetical protein AEAC466_18985 [Asticcacaulis sp. AC466]|nr:hypothetical protein AEAC466_18985 [Asticcacaulis sp. AC466]
MALLSVVGAMNSPRQDAMLVEEAGVELDRALFPLISCIGRAGSIGVVDLADQVGRDHSTVSRQVARLESMHLVVRQPGLDKRVNEAALTPTGADTVAALTAARERLMIRFLADWSNAEKADLTRLLAKLSNTLKSLHKA